MANYKYDKTRFIILILSFYFPEMRLLDTFCSILLNRCQANSDSYENFSFKLYHCAKFHYHQITKRKRYHKKILTFLVSDHLTGKGVGGDVSTCENLNLRKIEKICQADFQ